MKSKLKFLICLMVVFIASICFNTSEVLAKKQTNVTIKKDCYVYKKANKKSDKICKLNAKKKITIINQTKNKKWFKIKFTVKDNKTKKNKEKTGYVEVSKVNQQKTKKPAPKTGKDVVNYAKKFLGNPYKYGGKSLTNGTDCSGFVLSVYKEFGYNLPHSSDAQKNIGTKVDNLSKAKPGDIICYSGHVAIYMGNNKIIHASTYKTGIKISNNASYKKILAIRRLIQEN